MENNLKELKKERMKGRGEFSMLVAVDGSDYSRVVAKEAAKVASEKKADVVLLSIVPVPSLAPSEGEIDEAYLKEQETALEKLHNELIDKFFKPGSGALIESKVLHGSPADKIIHYAREMDADLIVVGTRGRGRVASTLLGSVSQHVVNHSGRSVLIVKSET